MLLYAVLGALALVAVHLLAPRLAGLRHSVRVIQDGDPAWLTFAAACAIVLYGSAVGVFGALAGELEDGVAERFTRRADVGVAFGGQAASTVVSAGGAGAIAVMAWALHAAGLPRTRAATVVIAYNVALYTVYVVAMAVLGVLAYVLEGAPLSLSLVPAGVAVLLLAVAVGARLAGPPLARRVPRAAPVLTALPSARALLLAALRRQPARVLLPVAYWGASIVALAACLRAFEAPVPLIIVGLGFFVGMIANLIPLLPGGVGTVEAGLAGALVGLGAPGTEAVVAVLAFRLLTFWLPTPFEAIALADLRRTVARWREMEPSEVKMR